MNNKLPNRYVKIVLTILIVALLFLCFLLVTQYHRSQMFRSGSAYHFRFPSASRRSLTAADVGSIQSWMTFDYINVAFNIPVTYLQTNLKINDVHYPHISLDRYASSQHLSPATVVGEVQAAVQTFLAQSK